MPCRIFRISCSFISVPSLFCCGFPRFGGKREGFAQINDNLVAAVQVLFIKLFAQDPRFGDESSTWFSNPLGASLEKVAMGPFGSNIKTDCFVESGVPVLNGFNIAGLLLDESSFRYVTEDKASELKNSVAVAGDIVVTHRGTLGQIALIPYVTDYERYVISQSQFMFRCKTECLAPEYILFYFKTDSGQRKLLANNNTTGVPSIAKPTTYIKELRVPIPPYELQRQWLALAKPSIEQISTIQKEIQYLCDLQSTMQANLAR
jgi:type I restriction enzyme S subunit